MAILSFWFRQVYSTFGRTASSPDTERTEQEQGCLLPGRRACLKRGHVPLQKTLLSTSNVDRCGRGRRGRRGSGESEQSTWQKVEGTRTPFAHQAPSSLSICRFPTAGGKLLEGLLRCLPRPPPSPLFRPSDGRRGA